MAGAAATNTGFPGVEVHGKSIRIAFMYQGARIGTRSASNRPATISSTPFKVPKTKKERTVLLQPPARGALKVLIADAEQREPADLTVWLNRHESRIDRVRVLLSPKTQAREKVVNDYFVPSACNTKWAIANQMGHSDYSMLVTVYGRWIDTESPRALERIWASMQNMAKSTPNLPHKTDAETASY
ncbi:hypothetical protein [Variovorax arabinosiphilus]|uniref:hypothetical protein n=1 Tax=Variovorax arabinosiphilus TaxID=3053498 RepID=UPI0025785D98|nr:MULTISPECIES: hypothetical protein [unclassified Variovorax]MDM0120008.1 hypothetical protein [Variovorax sp. J2L1-78]MDM0128080.1 hypothetical protein [Variovorax sp. J2L1-63]MDM0231780.1 hypothetical protein [Variovorax sp. J2R1-6]